MEVMVKHKLEKENRQETKIIIAKTALGNETNTTLLQNMILSHTKLIQATKMLCLLEVKTDLWRNAK